jgi:catechol 2,3-dioxygenase-like lactoylglutathione lyase family enzyme
MLTHSPAFSGFSVNNLETARAFYADVLGLKVIGEGEMGFTLHLATGARVFVYPKDNHEPASFTILNFPVNNIDEAMQQLQEKGVKFEIYPDMPVDDKGVLRGLEHDVGPNIAWFKDPAGNILSILQEKA